MTLSYPNLSPIGFTFSPQFQTKTIQAFGLVIFFRKLWFQNNKAYAITYELRHHYAIENINSWIGEGLNTHIRLLSLSKSMGHSDVESTKYYYSLVPGLSEIIENTSMNTFNDIIPNTENDEESK